MAKDIRISITGDADDAVRAIDEAAAAAAAADKKAATLERRAAARARVAVAQEKTKTAGIVAEARKVSEAARVAGKLAEQEGREQIAARVTATKLLAAKELAAVRAAHAEAAAARRADERAELRAATQAVRDKAAAVKVEAGKAAAQAREARQLAVAADKAAAKAIADNRRQVDQAHTRALQDIRASTRDALTASRTAARVAERSAATAKRDSDKHEKETARRLAAEEKALLASINRVAKKSDLLNNRFKIFQKVAAVYAAKIALAGIALVALLPTIVHVVNALAPLAGLLIALPAAALGAAAAIGVFKLATAGVGDALRAGLSGDEVAFARAMDKIPPAAQRFTKAVVSLRGPLRQLKSSVASAFFNQFTAQVRPLGDKYLPSLRTGLSRIGAATGGIVRNFALAARKGALFTGINAVLRHTALGIGRAGANVGKVTNALGHLLIAGAPALSRLGEAIGKASGKLADFITRSAANGNLKRWLDNAAHTFKQLWHITRNTADILRRVFAAEGSRGLLDRLESMTSRMDRFLKSARGIDWLKRAFNSADHTSKTLGQTFRTAAAAIVDGARRIGPTIRTLFDATNLLARAIAPALPALLALAGVIVAALVPALEAAARFFTKHTTTVRVLAILIGTCVLVFKAFTLALAFNNAITRLCTSATALHTRAQKINTRVTKEATAANVALSRSFLGNPYLLLAVAVAVLAAGIVYLAVKTQFFQQAWAAAWAGVTRLGEKLRSMGRDFVLGFLHGLQAGWDAVVTFVQNAVRSIPRMISRELGITSPSRVMAALGNNVTLGLAVGIRARIPALRGAMTAVSAAITGGVADPTLHLASPARTAPARVAPLPVNVHIAVAPGADPASVGRHVVSAIQAYERRTGRRMLAQAVL